MNSYETIYREKLYPFQDGILKLVKDLNLPFYLTGGTALSRFYYNHRYSDDLDFFVNDDPEFLSYVKTFLNAASVQSDFKLLKEKTLYSDSNIQCFIEQQDVLLKIDFINDIALHFGGFISSSEAGKIDSWRNILSNKISALGRLEPKDFVDIWVISINNNFSWKEIYYEAKQKELAVDPLTDFQLIKSFPFENIPLIKWISFPGEDILREDFNILAEDILRGNNNSLREPSR